MAVVWMQRTTTKKPVNRIVVCDMNEYVAVLVLACMHRLACISLHASDIAQCSDDAVVASVLKELGTHRAARPKPRTAPSTQTCSPAREASLSALSSVSAVLPASQESPKGTTSSTELTSSELVRPCRVADPPAFELTEAAAAEDAAFLAALAKADPKAAAKRKAAAAKKARYVMRHVSNSIN